MSDPKQIPGKTFATVSTKEDEMGAVLLWAVGIPIPVISFTCSTSFDHRASGIQSDTPKLPLRADASCSDSRRP
jgi:hypothetical protein